MDDRVDDRGDIVMSKYIDVEKINMEWQALKPFGVTDTMIKNLKWIVDR